MPAAELAKTVTSYNGFVKSGKDTQFERPNLPREIATAPFYALEIAPAVHHTMGGIVIDTKAEVKSDKTGKPIEGLYAAGEVTGGVHGANRLGGNAISDIVTYGRIAGASAAKYAKDH